MQMARYPMWLMLSLAVWLESGCDASAKRVEINGMDCRVNTTEIGAEPCCKASKGWVRLDASGSSSSEITASGPTCDPSNP